MRDSTSLGNLHSCTLCNRSFKSKKSLYTHQQRVDCEGNNFRCEACDVSFYKRKALEVHLNYHKEGREIDARCNICAKVFSSPRMRNRHIISIHFKDDHFSCSHCPAKLSSKNTLIRHVNKLHAGQLEPNCFKCTFCDLVLANKEELDLHNSVEHNPLRCDLCGKIFSDKQYLRQHIQLHIGESRHGCPHCPKTFSTAFCAKTHLLTHADVKPYECPTCRKSFAQKGNFHHHVLTMHKRGNAPLQCNICGKRFARKQRLEEHIRGHTGEKPFKCKLCHKAYQGDGGLRYHMRGAHTTEKKFSCDICGKRFYNQANLGRHKFTHVKEKKFSCAVCSKSFVRKSELRLHMVIHTTDLEDRRRHSCVFCYRRYTNTPALYSHIFGHIGERPYICELCPNMFKTGKDLRRHVSSHADSN